MSFKMVFWTLPVLIFRHYLVFSMQLRKLSHVDTVDQPAWQHCKPMH